VSALTWAGRRSSVPVAVRISKPRTYMSNGTEHTTNSVDRYYDYDPQASTPDWVRETEQAVASGNVQQMPSPQPAQQQMSWKNGGF